VCACVCWEGGVCVVMVAVACAHARASGACNTPRLHVRRPHTHTHTHTHAHTTCARRPVHEVHEPVVVVVVVRALRRVDGQLQVVGAQPGACGAW
jgi:hypothetical protein